MKSIYLFLFLMIPSVVFGAGETRLQDVIIKNAASIGSTSAANSKSALEITSTTKGVLLPRMTSTQRDNISSPPTGLLIYSTTDNQFYQYNGTSWATMTGSGLTIGDTIGSATVGSVLFASTSGVLAQSNSNFFYNSGNAALLLRSSTQYGRLGQALELNQSANYGGVSLSTWSTSGNEAPILDFNRSKSASLGTYTSVASGDVLGTIDFRGADGSVFRDGAAIQAQVDGTSGSGDMPGRLLFMTTPDGSTSLNERMRISNNGRIQVNSVHNNAGGCGASSTTPEICSMTYTPTVAATTNLSATTVNGAKAFRIGNMVYGMIQFAADPVTGGGTLTEIRFTLPIASNLASQSDCIGVIGHGEDIGTRAYIDGDPTNDHCVMHWKPSYSGNEYITAMFMYEVK